MTAIAHTPSSPVPNVDTDRPLPHPRRALTVVARRTATALVAAIVVTTAWTHRHQLGAGFHLLNHLSWWWLPAALLLEGASLATYAELQTRLLRAGDVEISACAVTKILMAANAMSASLPGGVAWSIPWSWKQLRHRGADRRVATWVVLVAGALSSFALFVMVVAGAELAGDHGPVASLRWWARALAVIPAAGGLLLAATRGRRRRHAPSGSRLAKLYDQTRVVRLSSERWAAAFTLALANWLLDLACLTACLAAVGAPIEWRDIVVVYALTQLILALPFTPGGLGVVEASLTALLVSYGTPAPSAIATVVLYRAITFWVLVPAGWVVWWRLDKGPSQLGSSTRPRTWRQPPEQRFERRSSV
jgi:uncharacterized membrane protein YbhN (UPF0104 family)